MGLDWVVYQEVLNDGGEREYRDAIPDEIANKFNHLKRCGVDICDKIPSHSTVQFFISSYRNKIPSLIFTELSEKSIASNFFDRQNIVDVCDKLESNDVICMATCVDLENYFEAILRVEDLLCDDAKIIAQNILNLRHNSYYEDGELRSSLQPSNFGIFCELHEKLLDSEMYEFSESNPIEYYNFIDTLDTEFRESEIIYKIDYYYFLDIFREFFCMCRDNNLLIYLSC